MKVTITMAMSLNGIIALADRTENFLSVEGGQLVSRLALEAGSLVWGRRTHEVVQQHFTDSIERDLASIPKVVVTTDVTYQVKEGYLVAHTPQAALKMLEKEGCTATAVIGGSELNTSFLTAGLVDEVAVNIEPVIVGKGLPLFMPQEFEVKTELISMDKVNNGELLLRYKVVK